MATVQTAQAFLFALLVAQLALSAHHSMTFSSAIERQAMDRPRSILDDASNPLSPRWSPRRVRTYPGATNGPSERRESNAAARQAPRRRPSNVRKQAPAMPNIEDVKPVPGDTRLVQLAFMHRHGARTAPQVHGTVLSWDHCYLSDQGAGMAVNLGQHLRQWYPTFIPTEYDRAKVVSTSTDVERTIRTGYGVLSGLYPRTTAEGAATANNFSIPLLHHVPMMQDPRLGYYYSWPAALLHQPELLAYNVESAAETRTYMTPQNLSDAGYYSGATQVCANATLATTCALFAEDVGTCHNSNKGISAGYRALLTKEKLFHAQALSNYFIYGPNTSKPFYRAVGPYGMKIVSDILDQFDAALAQLRGEPSNTTAAASPPVYHYSAHDITVYGFLVALGVIVPETTDIHLLVPTFTSLVRLELYSNATVTFLFSYCDQAYGTAHDYHVDEAAKIRCMDGAGNVYTARNCRIGDLRRYIATKLNITHEAYPPCYAFPKDVRETKCAPWHNTSLATVSDMSLSSRDRAFAQYCMTYRGACPAQACDVDFIESEGETAPSGAKYALNSVTLGCERVYPVKAEAEVPAAWVVCLFFGMGCFTTCALLAVAVFYCVVKVPAKVRSPEEGSLIHGEAGAPVADGSATAAVNRKDHHESGSDLYA